MTSYQSIPLDQIDATELARPIDPTRVEVLAKLIDARGLQQPIGVVPDEERFVLVFGAHRLEAVKSLGWTEIDARVCEIEGMTDPNQCTIDRVMENLGRGELNALERAEHLDALKRAYEAVYPTAKHGGDRKSKDAQDQVAMFAIRSEMAEKCGLSDRSIRMAIAICKGLHVTTRYKIHGTWLASHQAGLKLLSEQNPIIQGNILDILFAEDPKETTVADALIRANGERKIPVEEKRLSTVRDYMGRMKSTERTAIFQTFEDEVKEFAQAKGWF